MKTVFIFEPNRVLLKSSLFKKLIRIPEVSLAVKEFQKALDKQANFLETYLEIQAHQDLQSSESELHRNLLTIAIQFGLYNRHQSQFGKPAYTVSNNPLLLQLSRGLISVEKLIALKLEEKGSQKEFSQPYNKQYKVCQNINQISFLIDYQSENLIELLLSLKNNFKITSFVCLTPTQSDLDSNPNHIHDPNFQHISISDSITSDPILSWFQPQTNQLNHF